ncbi:MAG TPA: SAM-dependent chlorinase/fluorinase, partial [bacterium]|nr:SAM-dependent chlorinase/fluorinase [bacterium]
MRTNVISFITDFGTRDNFVGVMKGVILTINPEA